MSNIQQQHQQPSLNKREIDNINPKKKNTSSDNRESTATNNKSLYKVESMETNQYLTNNQFTETNLSKSLDYRASIAINQSLENGPSTALHQPLVNGASTAINQSLDNIESTGINQSVDNDGHVATNNSLKQKVNDEFLENKSVHSKKRIKPSKQNLVSVEISKTPCQDEDAAAQKSIMDGESTATHLDKLETNARNPLLKIYKCKECIYTSKIAICVENHQKIHAKYKPVACELCKFLCKTSLDLENHKQKVHRKIHAQKQRFFCKHTDTEFHLKYRPADCEDCVLYLKKEAKNLIRLKTLNEQAFQCKYCVFWTDTQDLYEYHVKSHEKYKPLSCSHCNVWCENRHALDNHLKRHQSHFKRSFEIKLCCDICSFVCNSKFLLVQHRKSHSTVASNSCQKCGKDFKYRIMLKKHELKCTSVRVDEVPKEPNDNIGFQEESDVDSDNSIRENPNFDSDSSVQNSESTSLKVIGKRKSSEKKTNGPKKKAKVAEKITTKERAPKRVATQKIAPKRVAAQKIAPKRVVPQKIAPKRVVPQEIAPKIVTAKDIAPKKVAAQKIAPKRVVPQKIAPKRVVPQEIAPKIVTAKDIAPKKVAAKERAPKRVVARGTAKEKVTGKDKVLKNVTLKSKAVKKVPIKREVALDLSDHNTGTQNIPVTIISSEKDTGILPLVLSCTEEPTFSNSNIKEEPMDTIENQIELAIVKEEDPILDSVIENVFFELPAVSQSPQEKNLVETAPILSKRLGNFEENTLIFKIEEETDS